MRTLNEIQIAFLALVIMVAIPFSAYAVDGQRKISQTPSTTFPIVINQSGSYILTSNLLVTDPSLHAIEIIVNDVTLDLNGHFIQGPNTGTGSGSGVYASGYYSITIKNGRVWGFGGYGVFLRSHFLHLSRRGAGHRIESIQAINNGGGFGITAGLLTNCIANNNNDYGMATTGSKIMNCTVSNNGDGISAISSIITNCTVNYNRRSGVDADDCRIEDNNLRNNGTYGIWLTGTNNYVIQNVASDNGTENFFFNPNDNYLPIWPAGGDNANYEFIPSDQGDWCEINSHPISLSFMYTGGGCAASNNAQNSSSWSCSGSIDPLQPISVTTSNTGYQINPTTVRPGEGFVVTNSGNRLASSSNFTLANQGGTEQLEIHTSCSQPLVQGDVFGSLTLINYTGE